MIITCMPSCHYLLYLCDRTFCITVHDYHLYAIISLLICMTVHDYHLNTIIYLLTCMTVHNYIICMPSYPYLLYLHDRVHDNHLHCMTSCHYTYLHDCAGPPPGCCRGRCGGLGTSGSLHTSRPPLEDQRLILVAILK